MNTNCNNFVTIDNNYSSRTVNNSRLVRYDGVFDPDKHQSTTSASYSTPAILPRMDFNIYSSNILTCTPLRNVLSNPLIPESFINVITFPTKFWRKKAINKYDPILYDDVDEDLYVFKSFGKSMTRTPHFVPRPRSNLILWDKTIEDVDDTLRQSILDIIYDNWDSFCKRSVSRPMLDFEFVLTRVIHPSFVVGSRFMVSMKVK